MAPARASPISRASWRARGWWPATASDLIDPVAMPLEAAYAAVINCDVPIVVQFGRQDTLALLGTIAFAGDE